MNVIFDSFNDKSSGVLDESVFLKRKKVEEYKKTISISLKALDKKENLQEKQLGEVKAKILENTGKMRTLLAECLEKHDLQTAFDGAQFLERTLDHLPPEAQMEVQKWCHQSEKQAEVQAQIIAGMSYKLTASDLEYIHNALKAIHDDQVLSNIKDAFLGLKDSRSILEFHLIVLRELNQNPVDAIAAIHDTIQGYREFQILFLIPPEYRDRDTVQSVLNLRKKMRLVRDLNEVMRALNRVAPEERALKVREFNRWSELTGGEFALYELVESLGSLDRDDKKGHLAILSKVMEKRSGSVSSDRLFKIAGLLPASPHTQETLEKCNQEWIAGKSTPRFDEFLIYLESIPIQERVDCLLKALNLPDNITEISKLAEVTRELSEIESEKRKEVCLKFSSDVRLRPFTRLILKFHPSVQHEAMDIALRMIQVVGGEDRVKGCLFELARVPTERLKSVSEKVITKFLDKHLGIGELRVIELLGKLSEKESSALSEEEVIYLVEKMETASSFYEYLSLLPEGTRSLEVLKMLASLNSLEFNDPLEVVMRSFEPERRLSLFQLYTEHFQDNEVELDRAVWLFSMGHTSPERAEQNKWFFERIQSEEDLQMMTTLLEEVGEDIFFSHIEKLYAARDRIGDIAVMAQCIRTPPSSVVLKLTERVPNALLPVLERISNTPKERQDDLLNRCQKFSSLLHTPGEYIYLINQLEEISKEQEERLTPYLSSFDNLVQVVQLMKISTLQPKDVIKGWRTLEGEQRDLYLFALASLSPIDETELARSISKLEPRQLEALIPHFVKITESKPVRLSIKDYLLAAPQDVNYDLVVFLMKLDENRLPGQLAQLMASFQDADEMKREQLNRVLPVWVERGMTSDPTEIAGLVTYLSENSVPDLENLFTWDMRMNQAIPLTKKAIEQFKKIMVRLEKFPQKRVAFRLGIQTHPLYREVIQLFAGRMPRPITLRNAFDTVGEEEQEMYLKYAEIMRARDGLLLAGYHIKRRQNEKLLLLSLNVCAKVGTAPQKGTMNHLLNILEPNAPYSVETKIAAATALGQIEENPKDLEKAKKLLEILRETSDSQLQAVLMDALSLYQLDSLSHEVLHAIPEGKERYLLRSVAFLLSTLHDEKALQKAAEIVQGPAWEKDRSLEAQVGRRGIYELFMHRPDFHDSRIHMEMLIAERLVEIYREKLKGQRIEKTARAEKIEALINEMPDSVRYVPYHIYLPPGCCLFRGISARKGEELERAALRDLLIKGAGSLDLALLTSEDNATWAKVGQVFASSTLDYVVNHFWDEDGILMTIPTEIFNEMQMRRSMRWQKEVSLHAVTYRAIQHYAISRLFLSKAKQPDIERLSHHTSKVDKDKMTSANKLLKIQQRHLMGSPESKETVLRNRVRYLAPGESVEAEVRQVMKHEGLKEATIGEIVEENVKRQSLREHLLNIIKDPALRECLDASVQAMRDPVII